MSESRTLLETANVLTALGFLVIPLNEDRKPTIKWAKLRYKPLSEEEITKWFSTDSDGNSRAKGIAIAMRGATKMCITMDTDGREATEVLEKELLPVCPPDIQKAFATTTYSKTPSQGNHWLFGINPEEFPKGIRQKDAWSQIAIETAGSKHSQINLMGTEFMLREYGPGYASKRGIECLVILSKEQVIQLLSVLEQFKIETSTLRTIGNSLKPYYRELNRDNLTFTVSGYLWKGAVPKYLTIRLIRHLVRVTAYSDDDDLEARLRVVEDTYSKDPETQVSGRQRLLAAVDGKEEVLAEIEQGFKQLNQEYFSHVTINDTSPGTPATIDVDPDINSLPFEVQTKLAPHVHSLIGYNPLRFYVADERKRAILKVVVARPKDITETTESNAATTTTTTKTKTIRYMEKDVIIDAIPRKVIINDNPLDGTKTYQVTFEHKHSKPFTIGPCSIGFLVEELLLRGRMVRTREAVEALTAIMVKYEDSGKADVTDKPPQSGYFWIDNKIVGYDTTQKDIDPVNREQDRINIVECIDILEALYTKNKNKVVFATTLKWGVGSAFSYARKQLNHGRSNWQPDAHAHGRTRTGKNTLAMYVLAIWRKHAEDNVNNHYIGWGSINSEAKFARAVSRTTYPITAHEVGPLSLERNVELVELEKHKVESLVTRGAHSRDNHSRFYNTLALSSIFLTGNPRPPEDPAYRMRVVLLPFDKTHDTTDAEKIEFEQWFYAEGRIDKLGVLGDWAAKSIISDPERFLKELSWHEAAKTIIAELYGVVGRETPRWIDLLEKPNVIQDTNEMTYFDLRGFLEQAIMEGFRKYHRYEEESIGLVINFDTKVAECLQTGYVPFLTQHTNKMRSDTEVTNKVVVTHDVIPELSRRKIVSITTMSELANAIPGFIYGSIKIGGEPMRVVYGSFNSFMEFLRPEMLFDG